MHLFCCLMLSLGLLTAPVVGSVPWAVEGAENSRYEQSDIGCSLADVLREDAETDIALIPAGDITAGLPGRELTTEDITAVFSENREIAVATLTAPELKTVLEHSCSHAIIDENQYLDKNASAWDGFLQISGCAYVYDVTAPVGQRVLQMQVNGADVEVTDESRRFTIAASAALFSGQYDYPQASFDSTGHTYTDALCQAVSSQELTRPEDERIRVVGSRDDSIIEHVGRGPLAAVMILAIIIIVAGFRVRSRATEA